MPGYSRGFSGFVLLPAVTDPNVPDAVPAESRPQRKKGRTRPQPPAGREPHPLLHRLAELYPQLFGARFLPLKLGIYEDLLQRHGAELDKDALKIALGQHARSSRYLDSVASGAKRHDLDGQAAEEVAPEHRQHAIMEVFRRRQARSREDLRPWLIGRLVQAIEDSGLERDAYMERVRTSDPAALQALEDAFGALRERAAKREAVRRAFEASGRSVEEFAEMYGLDVESVRAAVS
jgi:sRNA-binding protein